MPRPPAAPTVPALDTARLTLRGHTVADFAECAAMWADPLVTRYIGGRPATEEEVWARVLRWRTGAGSRPRPCAPRSRGATRTCGPRARTGPRGRGGPCV